MLEKIDAYLFKLLGVALGFAGCAALVMNNPMAELISNIYGIIFFIIFATLGVYSTISVIRDILPHTNRG
ncbi:MAG: hypothetical protein HZB29_14210 [Nitrospinae bacterium]|nr:hypothetical protein [Nitrospinota bacterium]